MVRKLSPSPLTRPAFTLRDALDAVSGTFASVNTAAARLVEASVFTIANRAREGQACIKPMRC
jgi:hypothetical protein